MTFGARSQQNEIAFMTSRPCLRKIDISCQEGELEWENWAGGCLPVLVEGGQVGNSHLTKAVFSLAKLLSQGL